MKWRKDGGVKKVEEKEDKYWLNLETPEQRKSRFNVLNQAKSHLSSVRYSLFLGLS